MVIVREMVDGVVAWKLVVGQMQRRIEENKFENEA